MAATNSILRLALLNPILLGRVVTAGGGGCGMRLRAGDIWGC